MTLFDEVVGLREDLKKFRTSGILHIPEGLHTTSEDENAAFVEELVESTRLPLTDVSADGKSLQCCKISAPAADAQPHTTSEMSDYEQQWYQRMLRAERENESLRGRLTEIEEQLAYLVPTITTVFSPLSRRELEILDTVSELIEQALSSE